MEELVKGVLLRRAGEFLERAGSPNLSLELLAAWDGTEVILQRVAKGRRFILRPEDGWDALEFFYVLKGTALWTSGERQVLVGPGDCLAAQPVQEPCILQARSSVLGLYVSSRPVFHMASGEVHRLSEIAMMVETKDGYTRDHCRRIQALSAEVGRYLGLSPTRQFYLLYGSFLHDLGKLDIPDEILKKPGKLTAEEWEVMRRHPSSGSQMLRTTFLAGAAPIVHQHHERLDGSGYPKGLAGEQISLEAQIVAVVDSFDAMTSDRVYRPALTIEEAIEELRKGAGRAYRADVVDALIAVLSNRGPGER